MILVTSAAGNTGRIMVQKLVEAGLDVLATDINPKVKDLPGIKKAVVGDLTDLSFIGLHSAFVFSGRSPDRSTDGRQSDRTQD